MKYTEAVEKFKSTELGYTLSLFAQKEVIYVLMGLVILVLLAGVLA